MRDDELRDGERAARHGDLQTFRRAAFRAPAPLLAELHQRLFDEAQALGRILAILDDVVPKCWCGHISDGLCEECAKDRVKAQELLRTWQRSPIFVRWCNGDDAGCAKDAIKLAKLWWSCFPYPHQYIECVWPWCPSIQASPDRPWERYCSKHRWLKGVKVSRSVEKGRGS